MDSCLRALGTGLLLCAWVGIGAAQEPVRIGVLLPYTGVYAVQAQDNTRGLFVKDYETAHGSLPSRYSETGYTGAQLIVRAVQLLAGDLKDRDAVVGALRKAAGQIESPRGPVKLDKYGQVIPTIYITRTERKEGKLVNSVVDEIPNVTQESTWGWWMKDAAK